VENSGKVEGPILNRSGLDLGVGSKETKAMYNDGINFLVVKGHAMMEFVYL